MPKKLPFLHHPYIQHGTPKRQASLGLSTRIIMRTVQPDAEENFMFFVEGDNTVDDFDDGLKRAEGA